MTVYRHAFKTKTSQQFSKQTCLPKTSDRNVSASQQYSKCQSLKSTQHARRISERENGHNFKKSSKYIFKQFHRVLKWISKNIKHSICNINCQNPGEREKRGSFMCTLSCPLLPMLSGLMVSKILNLYIWVEKHIYGLQLLHICVF